VPLIGRRETDDCNIAKRFVNLLDVTSLAVCPIGFRTSQSSIPSRLMGWIAVNDREGERDDEG
jgi:hypothetical protein